MVSGQKDSDMKDHKLKPMRCELNYLNKSDGSAILSQGDTVALVSVNGPLDIKMGSQSIEKATLEVLFSAKSGKPSVADRYKEHVIKQNCEAAILSSLYPRSGITVTVQELEDFGGLLSCCVNCCCLALLNSGVMMKSTFAAVTCILDQQGNVQLEPAADLIASAVATLSFVFDSRDLSLITGATVGQGAGERDWRDVVSEAEQIVGYPPSFLSLRWLLNDEIANTAIHLRKLVGTNHPLLKSAKNLLMGSKSNLQSVGLIVLLVSKAAGFNPQLFTRDQYDSGVLHSQRALAEIVEMKRTGHMIHKTMVNLCGEDKKGEKFKDLLYGNKIVLLTGDFLFATCLQHLGGLRNNEVTELVSSGLRDLVEGDSIGERDKDNNPMPSQPKGSNDIAGPYDWENEDNLQTLGSNEFLGQGKDEWILRTMLQSGSMLGKGCQGAMKLAQRGKETERDAYRLGGHLALLWQLYLDVKDFFTHPHSYSLVGAPVTIAFWEYPQLYGHILEPKLEKRAVEYKQLYYSVLGTRSLEYLSLFVDDELAAVLKYIDKFPDGEAKAALRKMALTIYEETKQYMEE